MGRKLLVVLLVFSLCTFNLSALAKQNSNSKGQAVTVLNENAEVVVTDESQDNTDEEIAEGEDSTNNEEIANDENTSEEEVTEENPIDEQPVEDENSEVAKDSKTNNSKIIKEELSTKKQERSDARLEAKEYINEIKGLFKDADTDTRKEILGEIAKLKAELKDYSIGVFVKGIVVDFEKYDNVKPIIKENRTLVPVRAITETFGATVDWNEETKTITITKDDVTIIMQLDNKTATVNGEEVELDVAPTTIKDRTIVPIRFISETLGFGVEWDENSQTIIAE